MLYHIVKGIIRSVNSILNYFVCLNMIDKPEDETSNFKIFITHTYSPVWLLFGSPQKEIDNNFSFEWK